MAPTQADAVGSTAAPAQPKRLPLLLRPVYHMMVRSPAAVRGMCIAMTVYWLQQLARHLGWVQ
jgi:hypothetical protein